MQSRPLLPMLRPVGINPVPIPLTPLMPLNVPGPGALIPVGMPAPLCFCSAQQPQCCPLKRLVPVSIKADTNLTFKDSIGVFSFVLLTVYKVRKNDKR